MLSCISYIGCMKEVGQVDLGRCDSCDPIFGVVQTGGSDGSLDPCICAICLDRIKLAETAQIKGCEHSYW